MWRGRLSLRPRPNIADAVNGFAPSLNPALDWSRLAEAYRRDGRVRIDDLLDPASADELERVLLASDAWLQMVNSGDKLFELSREVRASFDADRSAALQAAVDEAARWGFQYRYEALRVPDAPAERSAAGRPIDRFAAFLSSEPVLRFLQAVTGQAAIGFADAQATRYNPGDFLTGHDDEVAGKNRVAAYVYGLTRRWRVEWGGLLLFHESDGQVSGLVPAFNSLTLFSVPQPHSVSIVTSFAGAPRLSITGWLRAGQP